MTKYEQINFHAERIAAEIHRDFLINPYLRYLKDWIEINFGCRIKIVFQDLSKFICSGLIHFDPVTKGYRIIIHSKDTPQRQRFTFCHEIGHLIRNLGLKYGLSTGDIYSTWGIERFCNRFAAAFLMPEESFINKWNSIPENDVLKKARIAKYFRVSVDAVYFRSKELKLIP
ncbi:MAG: ImmA/IrrE family metallo-endopeptidase [Parcubacteria group bacterium]|nr:ImmA/IrrE family metallo-endopeptidase [Parcubacteria group bacterium]